MSPRTSSLPALFKPPDTSLQLRRDVIFCQAATGALCTFAEQLLAALRSRFNNAGEYQEDGTETSRKWLEQISVIGVLMHFQSTLSPHLVRLALGRAPFRFQPHVDPRSYFVMSATCSRSPLKSFLWILPSERRADHARRHQGSTLRFGQSDCVLQAAGGRVSRCK